ncbi:class I glutamine amidotransferase-like protein [Mycena belliarum]|uniref:Class I glutamine amidotransferase-like protein n=1 Tax=Mycena belliarum TaxID=1033014 RepID=A0AAD6XN64_9AGAR|nr:class I glutamine amidotransferase-like protein [Mycena belliae]
MPQLLSIAVCVSDDVTLSDFITPIEILASLNDGDHPIFGAGMPASSYRVAIEYLAPTMDPVVSVKGRVAPTFNPTLTYADAMASGKQFDVLWVPAGAVDARTIPKEEIAFIAQQAPKAKYVMSVCGGAVQLAFAGVLAGKRATTNKVFYRQIVEATPKDIQWVPKARWVVDGNVWTSSGVAAGSDMALAFVEHLAGREVARFIRGGIEIPEVTEEDDPFAAFHGLV